MRISFIVPIILCINLPLIGQNESEQFIYSIGFNYEFVNNSPLKILEQSFFDFDGNKTDNGIFPSDREWSSFGSLYGLTKLSPFSSVGMEFFFGKSKYRYEVVLDEEIINHTRMNFYLPAHKNRYVKINGLTLLYQLNMNLNQKSSVFLSPGIGIISTYFSPNKGAVNSGRTTVGIGYWHEWNHRIKFNEELNFELIYYLRLGFSYEIVPRLTLNTSAFMRHSNMITHRAGSIYAVREIDSPTFKFLHTGLYHQKFRHYGLQVGLQYNFGKDF
ncbi:MAG: hypothetical protein EA362_00005 [Saprospirales bacterium]|nr:MAG: hypothetical protein EA362_00005 [Saprospirales bacterium]